MQFDQPKIDLRNGSIVSAVIAMGNRLKQWVVAEGIEQQGQLKFLHARKCDEGQGYLFSHAVNAEHFTGLLRTDIERFAS